MKALLALSLALLLGGCRPLEPGSTLLAPRTAFHLRPPAEGPRIFETQEVVFELPDGRTETLLTTVENGPEALSVVASTPLGQTLFVIRMEGDSPKVDARIPLPQGLDPLLVPALIQFSRWPLASVRKGLGPGVEVREEGTERWLVRGGRVLWRQRRDPEGLSLENPALRIRARIRILEG